MKKHSIGSRVLSLLLTVVMLLSMVPAIETSAATVDEDGYLENVKFLNNSESISLPIKINNFAVDGLLFEYLADVSSNRNAQHYVYEQGGFYQLLTFHLANKKVGVNVDGTNVFSDVGPDSDAISAGIDQNNSLHGEHGTSNTNYLGVTSGGAEYYATLAPYEMTDGGGAKYLQLRQYHRDSYALSGRTWRKLTSFSTPHTMDKSRYAVIIYRVNGNTTYDNMLLTWDCYDEVTSGDNINCSQTVSVKKNTTKAANSQWQYAIIDLAYRLGSTEEERATAAKNKTIQDIYLKSPLNFFKDGDTRGYTYQGVSYPATGNSMDLAAVAYFPYYGDAEQFANYGLTLGSNVKYFGRNNSGFSFRNSGSGYSENIAVYNWDDQKGYGKQVYDTANKKLTLQATDGDSTETGILNTVNELGYALFGETSGYATMGLLESQLGENGRPVYKEAVVSYVAYLLQKQLTAVAKYPSDNYGWKNASFVTGVSTTSGVDEARFGKDSLGHSLDLGSALCTCVEGATIGVGAANNGTMGTYDQTNAKAKELIGSWDECNEHIDTWFDAAYYLLHNLYVTDDDTRYDADGYGEYEDDYQHMILPQVSFKDGDQTTTAYCFDTGFCISSDTKECAVVYDKDNHALTMNTNVYRNGSTLPFLPTSGNGTEDGESNSPYSVDPSAIDNNGGYQKRDYHFTISGNGYFQYESDLFFEFEGDDDVYLFINGELVLDIGSTHGPSVSKIKLDDYVEWAWSVKEGNSQYKGKDYANLEEADRARIDALAMEEGGLYSFDFFYMERHGAGSNLRIVTNIKVSGEGMDVEKFAYQNGIEIAENGIVDANKPIEYSFKITNNTGEDLHHVIFHDAVIGVTMDYENGLQIDPECLPYVRNKSGNPLTAADLEIYVFGKDSSQDVIVTCNTDEELKYFLENLTSNDGTQSGEGLWVGSSIQIRGIYYQMTDVQKNNSSFRNFVTVTADTGNMIYRGADDHTVYQPGKPAYYQWVGKPVVIEREQLYSDLIESGVATKDALPALGNMILVPSDSYGIERQDNGLVNTRGGDIYLRINYLVPRSYIAYVTIRDQTNPDYRLTVPITVYVTDAQDSTMVLDYGLDSYLTDQEAIFDYELDLAVGDYVTGTVMGIADQDSTPSYKQYDTGTLDTAVGNTRNDLTLLRGSSANGAFSKAQYQLDTPIYLDHTKPWVLEFKIKNMTGTCFFFGVTEGEKVVGNEYLFLRTDFIALGHYNGTNYYNYAARTTALADKTSWHTIKMYNVIGYDDSNMVYLSVDGGTGVAMNNYYVATTDKNTTDDTWINGRDFTFNFLGGNDTRGLSMSIEYLRVYEEGEQLVHHRWEKNGTAYNSVDTGKPGYEEQQLEYYTINYDNKTYDRWKKLNVTLNSDRAWTVEFGLQLSDTSDTFMLLSSAGNTSNYPKKYIYFIPHKGFVSMGLSLDGDTYINYGAILPDGFEMTAYHSYLLKNRINADGTNMVYLYVDKDENGEWTEVGPLNYYSEGANIGVQSTGLSGIDFNFRYVGGHNHFSYLGQNMSYLEIHEDTALRTVYEWKPDANGFTSIRTTSDGNRIQFTKDEDGVVTDDSGTFTLDNDKLKFETSDFMDQAYTAYVALTIHDKDHVPTSLNQTGVNVAKEVQMYKKVSVIPANVVYYEDDFPALHYVTGNANVITSIGTSTLDQLQSPDQHTAYGSDEFYQNDFSDNSAGHVHKIQIKEDNSCLAWFGFRGTGFELISSTTAKDSAMIYLEVYNRSDVNITDGGAPTAKEGAAPVAWIPLDPEFDHQNNDGTEVIYQVPLIRWQSETMGAYVVTINAYATYDFSQDDKGVMLPSYLYIDGIRIFQPMGYDVDGYTDVENKVLFDEVRDYIIDGKINACEKTESGVVISSGTVTWTEKFTGRDYTGTFFEGNKVNSVNDYLLKGPNNEVYMDGTFTESSLAFVVYPDADHKYSDLGLQIGVRAIDVGNFYGAASTGMKANLEIGVTDASGSCGWMHLATVSTGTEQYITVPYELCPVINNDDTLEYHVVIRVSAFAEDIPAMVSFSSLKRSEGLELKEGIGEALTIYQDDNGVWCTDQGHTGKSAGFGLLSNTVSQDSIIDSNNAVRGENFVNDTVVPDGQPAILPQYPVLSFEEEVQYHVFYTVQNLGDVALEDMGLITFDTENQTGTVSDAMDVIPGAVNNGEQYIVHTNGISAKKLGDTLYFKVYAKLADGSFVYSDLYNYSAKTYAMNQLKGTNDAVKPLVVAMLNYGTAAQQFFGYRTDSLMNAELTADQQALVRQYDSNMATAVVPADSNKVGTFVSNGGFTRMRPSVTFGGAFSINYFFTPAYAPNGEITMYYWDAKTYASVEELTTENALGSEKMVPVDGGEYFAAYTDIAAKEIGDTVYVAAVYEVNGQTYCTGVLPYSLSLYCKRFAENSESAAQDLAAATMVYGYYAEQFFGIC